MPPLKIVIPHRIDEQATHPRPEKKIRKPSLRSGDSDEENEESSEEESEDEDDDDNDADHKGVDKIIEGDESAAFESLPLRYN
jgi:Mg-chelatase subunit ChlI